MIVCIAEKPSVARDIADVLGAKDRRYRRKRISGDLDIRSPLYTQGTARIYPELEIMELGKLAYDTTAFRNKTDQ